MTEKYTKTFTGSIVAEDGVCRHFISGALGRPDDLPAVEYPDGTKVWYTPNPKRGGIGQHPALENRENGPALIRANGDQFWYRMGKLHREDGPAVELHTGVKKWFVNGEFIRAENL